MKILWQK